jgi:hypothetical protein
VLTHLINADPYPFVLVTCADCRHRWYRVGPVRIEDPDLGAEPITVVDRPR